MLILNSDDPKKDEYQAPTGWGVAYLEAGSRVCDAWRLAFQESKDRKFFGILSDDMWPITPKWWEAMEEAAGNLCVSLANGVDNFPMLRNVCCLGGELVETMGFLAPPEFKHNYVDNVWETVARDFNLLRPLQNVVIEHHHPIFGYGKRSETYDRGSHDIQDDQRRFQQWMMSPQRREMGVRIAKIIGAYVSEVDLTKLYLAICVPVHDWKPDMAFQQSMYHMTQHLRANGLRYDIIPSMGGSNVGKARETLLWLAMKTPATHIMFVDSDMGWPVDLVANLISTNLDFTGVAGVRKTDKPDFCFNPLPNPQIFHPSGLLQVADVGFGLVVFKRKVVELLIAAYPELQYKTGDGSKQYALFMEYLRANPAGGLPDRLSEDLSFCSRWTEIGGEIWIDPNVALIHAGRKEYTGRVSDIFERTEIIQAAE